MSEFEIVLGAGFWGHTVVILLDGREAYRQLDVATDPATSHADRFVATSERRYVHILVRVTPGDLVLSVDCDLRAHTRAVISLIGKASLWIETDAAYPRVSPRTPRATPAAMARGL